MSTYYSFYIGYKTKDSKYHAYGPFDKDHKLRPVLEKSRSFISNIYEDFIKLPIEEMDEFLKKHFTYNGRSLSSEERIESSLYYLPVSKLPGTNFVKRGYYTTEDIVDYLANGEPYFSEYYEENEYAIRLSVAFKNGDTEELDRLKKFSYFCYPDYESKEYESFVFHHFLSFQGPFDDYHIKESIKTGGEELEDIIILMNIS